MTTYLLASASVHTTATVCDYLVDRLADDDTVMVLGVVEPGAPQRDVGDAINVARARLAAATVWTERREGEPVEEILELAADIDADELLVGRRSGDPERQSAGLGSTAAAVAGEAERPVVVVPV
ncbi:universal stress protein [Halapricum desulfuricans]|uniref:Nucleotide-binding protein, UspA family n=1 Tax=Halapricum desulfuricans TaxID=2841257 RepID=A0A897N7D0_9EURY|nr:universal stress protein [Halapricum desulfuricans]QSG08464.1 Nucleotide-binding protein, UspA family [Halapricum desulfuricans]QSG12411.1 Nucleotide-binding protein, UspA family [Halapricum desulfuricans]